MRLLPRRPVPLVATLAFLLTLWVLALEAQAATPSVPPTPLVLAAGLGLWWPHAEAFRTHEGSYVTNSRVVFSKVGSTPLTVRYAAVRFAMDVGNVTNAAEDVIELMHKQMYWATEPQYRDEVLKRMDEPHEAYRHMSHDFGLLEREERFHSLSSRAHTLINRAQSFMALFLSLIHI